VLIGRHLQKESEQKQQAIITVPILEGVDGVQKMSKSLGNHIGITEAPDQIFGKIMSIPDTLIVRYFALLTDIAASDIKHIEQEIADGAVNPKNHKEALAMQIITMLYDEPAASKAKEQFSRIFSQGENPDAMPEISCATISGPVRLDQFLCDKKIVQSKKEAGRLIKQGAVDLDGAPITDPFCLVTLAPGQIFKIGKRRFFKIA